jgi:hypothetical protein
MAQELLKDTHLMARYGGVKGVRLLKAGGWQREVPALPDREITF